MGYFVEASYFATAVLFILGLKRMSHPTTARSGIVWAGAGMVLATVFSFLHPAIVQGHGNYLLMILAIIIGSAIAWWSGKRVAMTDMPQMIAIYNGMGGGAAGAIAAVELFRGGEHLWIVMVLAVLGALIGTVSFSGSVIAWAKLDGRLDRAVRFPNQQLVNLVVFALMVLLGVWIAFGHPGLVVITLFFLLALAFGAMMALPIGGADMPVVISLFNAFTGLAVAFEGFVLQNSAMIIAGTVVGSAGALLTQLMAKAMNRPISNVLFSSFGQGGAEMAAVEGVMKASEPQDAAVQMAY
ncbi:MAG: NAD(P)(+) transhydrogenase (Re/Si-specific) subunit beta, partial [Burkholderiaceae bacterium]|nr:NAD(P)(+) transhydrogenase (Re/Si-specific) subunit beta [Burkholderiaceae bacterium]